MNQPRFAFIWFHRQDINDIILITSSVFFAGMSQNRCNVQSKSIAEVADRELLTRNKLVIFSTVKSSMHE
jgi:hypothetical protein